MDLEPLGEDGLCVDAIGTLAVGVASPGQKRAGEVLVALPVAGLNEWQNTGAISTRLGTEDAIARLSLGLVRR